MDLSQLQCIQQPVATSTIPQLLFKSPPVIPGFNSKPVKAQKRPLCLRKNPVTLCQLGRIRGFKICHLNMRSLVPKLDEFKIMLAQTKAHVMAISESWLTPIISDSFLVIENFSLYRRDRADKIGGGVTLYANKKYAHSIVKLSTVSESLQLVVQFTNQFSVTIIVTYKPPNVSPTAYILQLSDLIKSVKTKELVILGDINLNWIDNLSKLLKTTAIKYGLHQLIKDPTRFGKT